MIQYPGNYRGTSDEFFKQNKNNFDCIFIDGLHTYKQVKNDILNSIKFLNEDGVILVHDCLPANFYQQAVPRCKMLWTGDVWKSIVELKPKIISMHVFVGLIWVLVSL